MAYYNDNRSRSPYAGSISFLPDDTINPAIQNLAKTISADNERRIAQAESMQKQFQALLDVSYEGTLANHQQELMTDWEKLRGKAISIFSKASDNGVPVNMVEYAGLMKQHKELIAKAEYAKSLKADYMRTVTEAAKLKKEQRLDPDFDEAINTAMKSKTGIYDQQPYSTYLVAQLSPKDVDLAEKDMFTESKLMKEVPIPGGYRKYYDPENVAKSATDEYKVNPMFAKYVDRNYGGLDKYIVAKQGIFNKEYEHKFAPKAGGTAALPLDWRTDNRGTFVPVQGQGYLWDGSVEYTDQYGIKRTAPVNDADVINAYDNGWVLVNATVPVYSASGKQKGTELRQFYVDDAFNAMNKVKKSKQYPTDSAPKKTQKKYPLPEGKPRTVKQNGYTYTWNENTGNYE